MTDDTALARGLRAVIDYEVPDNPEEYVPVELLTAHERYLTAYLLVETDLDRQDVIKSLDLSPATIISYRQRVEQDDPEAET